jgi:hypothetical protein
MNSLPKKISNSQYHKAEGISSSDLKLLEISPLHLKYKELFRYESEVFDFGSLVHKMTLEPESLEEEFVKMPEFNLRTKAGKEEKAKFEEENQGKVIISPADWERAEKMSQNILAIAGNLINAADKEMSVFAEDEYGLIRKARPDAYIDSLGVVIDIKTTQSTKPYDFQKAIYEYRYHYQAYWYLKTLELAGKKAKQFIFIAVEKKEPFMVRLFRISKNAIERAKVEVEELIQKYVEFLKSGKAEIVEEIDLPNWA